MPAWEGAPRPAWSPLAHPPSFRLSGGTGESGSGVETPPGIPPIHPPVHGCHLGRPLFLERAGRKHPWSPSRLPSRFRAERWRIGCASYPRLANLKVSRSVGARVKSRERETRCSPYWEYHLGYMTKSCPPFVLFVGNLGAHSSSLLLFSCPWTFHSSCLVHLNLCKLNFRRLLLRSQDMSLNCRME